MFNLSHIFQTSNNIIEHVMVKYCLTRNSYYYATLQTGLQLIRKRRLGHLYEYYHRIYVNVGSLEAKSWTEIWIKTTKLRTYINVYKTMATHIETQKLKYSTTELPFWFDPIRLDLCTYEFFAKLVHISTTLMDKM